MEVKKNINKELISIIIPVYNVEKYIFRMLDKVTNQTYSNIEIILIDDGSTDRSGELCDQWSEKDSRIRIIHKKNGGLSSARNVGINIAKGSYYIFVDSDDYISLDCVEYLYTTLCEYDADIVIGNYIETGDDNVKFQNDEIFENKLTGEEAIKEIYGKRNVQMVTAWGKIFKSVLFKNIHYPEGLLHEDEGTTYKLYHSCKKIVLSSKPVYAYFIDNNESITRKPKPKNYRDLCNVLEEQINFFEKYNDIDLVNYTCARYCIQAASHYLPLDYYENHKKIRIKSKQFYNKIQNKKSVNKILLLKAWLCTRFTLIIAIVIKVRKTL